MYLSARTLLLTISLTLGASQPAEALGRRARCRPQPTVCQTVDQAGPSCCAVADTTQFDCALPPSAARWPGSDTQFVCAHQPVPAGWIVLSYASKSGCPGNNGMYIQRLPTAPGSKLFVCAHQPVPAGWVAESYTPKSGCPGNNGMWIRKL